MQASQQNNGLYFIVGALVIVVALMGYWMYTGTGPISAPKQDGVNITIDDSGIRGTINSDGN